MTRFTGNTVPVTGAGTGIGSAFARKLRAEGANIALLGRRTEPLDAVAEPNNGLVLPVDATSTEQVNAVIAQIHEHFGLIDVLVCNADGLGPKGARCNTICPGWLPTEMAEREMAELITSIYHASITRLKSRR